MKVSDLCGASLDWAVAKCEGEDYIAESGVNGIGFSYEAYRPSTDWNQGGPIIERMGEAGLVLQRGSPFAGNQRWWTSQDSPNRFFHGPTPLIAAMRCYVASKLGDEIEIPKELTK